MNTESRNIPIEANPGKITKIEERANTKNTTFELCYGNYCPRIYPSDISPLRCRENTLNQEKCAIDSACVWEEPYCNVQVCANIRKIDECIKYPHCTTFEFEGKEHCGLKQCKHYTDENDCVSQKIYDCIWENNQCAELK